MSQNPVRKHGVFGSWGPWAHGPLVLDTEKAGYSRRWCVVFLSSSSPGPVSSSYLLAPPGACGKTSLLCSFALGEFPKEYVSFGLFLSCGSR